MGLIYDGLMYERIYEILKDRIESECYPLAQNFRHGIIYAGNLEYRLKPSAACYPC